MRSIKETWIKHIASLAAIEINDTKYDTNDTKL